MARRRKLPRRGALGARPDWRTYQANLKRKKSGKTGRRILICGFLALLAGVAAFGVADTPPDNAAYLSVSSKSTSPEVIEREAPAPEKPAKAAPESSEPEYPRLPAPPRIQTTSSTQRIDKTDVQAILASGPFINLEEESFEFRFDGHGFRVDTSLDSDLQRYLLQAMQRDTSRHIGIIVMDPRTGRVLSMVGFDREDPLHNPCLNSIFPAASVFKIVTAAAAIEKCGFNSNSTVSFSGKKYTLYKNQIRKEPKGWVRRFTLQDSFAQSINPVFGKIGAHFVGKTGLEVYADAFGFNRPINFELPVTPSHVSIRDEAPYQWAEIASGFNRQTTLSPLHGAVMVSAIVTGGGNLVEPTIVDRIRSENDETLYTCRPATLHRALSRDAAAVMKKLMAETIKSGTGRKIFRGHDTHPILSRLHIGGKTGSINSRTHAGRRFDWFVGFAEERTGSEQIVFSIVVAHEKFIGLRSLQYGRMAIEHYFQKFFSKKTYAGTCPDHNEKG
ncbi:MAG: penicillin-binding transpeptidase domain-containing protein [Thermodesulfobacteriota bacterium]